MAAVSSAVDLAVDAGSIDVARSFWYDWVDIGTRHRKERAQKGLTIYFAIEQ